MDSAWDRDLQEKLLTLSERHLDVLASICPPPIMCAMQEVLGGDRGTTEEKARLLQWYHESPNGFMKELSSLEREYKRSLAAMVKASVPVQEKTARLATEEKSRGKKEDTKEDGGEEKALELVENLLREWGEGRQ